VQCEERQQQLRARLQAHGAPAVTQAEAVEQTSQGPVGAGTRLAASGGA
jgi:hypothetical protein